jgi:bifunctional oligoribonuclease and PAP phosphatase NrnA
MNFDQAIEQIESAQSILITTHVRPDGDAVGCVAALKRLIGLSAQRAGRSCNVQMLFLSYIPENYQFLLSEPPWILGTDIKPEQIEQGELDSFDLIVILDTSAPRQLPDLDTYLKRREKPILVIDHHLAGDDLGTCQLINTDAAATGEIIFDLAQHANWPIDKNIAAALFAAISTDTGWFRFSNTTAHTYEITSQLVTAGANPALLYRNLLESYPPERVRLLTLALDSLELLCGNRLAVMNITKEMLAQSGADRTLIENIVNEPQQIASVVVSVLLVERDDGTTRASLRSLDPVDVSAIARQYGGGGHAQAAGVTLDVPIPQARQKLIEAIAKALE